MIDFQTLFANYSIPTNEKGRHSRKGWVQTYCPFCYDGSLDKWHGGFNASGEFYNCWKCGWHPLLETLSILLNNISIKETRIIVEKYKEGSPISEENAIRQKGKFSLPPYCQKMDYRHRDYLRKRGFDSERLEMEWKLMGTPQHGDYKLRVIAPIILDGRVVSYQGRDITEKAKVKYKACSMDKETIHHKAIVYGFDRIQECKHKDRCIIVEGIFDAWRLGAGTVATFGTGFTDSQVLFIARRGIKTSFIMYDPEEKAQEQAEKLSLQLNGFGVESKIVDISSEKAEDPATLSEKKAQQIRKELLE